jgi:TPR repeat protein
MKLTKITLLVISLSPFYGSSQAIANVYKYVDKSGQVFYTDDPKIDDYYLLACEGSSNHGEADNYIKETIKVAEGGNANAQFEVGCKFSHDYQQAFKWIGKAAEQNHHDAQYELGKMYFNGSGVARNYKQAVFWYQKAAEQGNVSAQYILGKMYKYGKGVPKDSAKAVEWLLKAAEQGNVSAQILIGTIYEDGEGIPKDFSKAVKWYRKAAAQGNLAAQVYLGSIYERGKIVSRDRVQAYAWFNLAAAQGDAEGQKYRDKLEKELPDNERIEGQRLASNWKKGDNLLPSTKASTEAAIPGTELRIQSTGTAFTVSRTGHMLTNYHVVKGCAEIKIAGRNDTVKVITSDSVNDLALLQLSGETHDMAKLNPDAGKLRQGEDIFVFGYPLNFVLSSGGNFTPGTISALAGLGNNTNQLQITAPIQPGSSGSPVMDKKGNLVGLVSMKLDDSKLAKATGQVGQNVNFAINGQTVKVFLDINQVPYKTGGGLFSFEKSNADIAEEARKWTMLVECWR